LVGCCSFAGYVGFWLPSGIAANRILNCSVVIVLRLNRNQSNCVEGKGGIAHRMRAPFFTTGIILSCLLAGCHNYVCKNELPVEHPSPNGQWKYVVFDRNCGATTTSNFQVSVLPASFSLPNEAANAFIGDYNHGAASYVADVAWVDFKMLQISYSSRARIFRKEAHVGPIEIRYVVKP
jgi:hypothetical protein